MRHFKFLFMKKSFPLLVMIFLVRSSLFSQDLKDNYIKKVEELIGNWKIDLRPSPESDGYYQYFNIDEIDGNSFIGTFYGSEIRNAIINQNWPKLYFAFSTSDQNNEYYHSGYLENGKLFGITYCPNREFANPWIGIIN